MSPELDSLIQHFAKLPGFGPRSARRVVLRLMQNPEARMVPLADAMLAAARAVKLCEICNNLDAQPVCGICADPGRDRQSICVVETVGDLWALERARAHSGLYHVLGATLSPIAGTGPADLRLDRLARRLTPETELILALSATVDGAATAHYVAETVAATGARITRPAQGVPIGGALEILDDGTLAAALRARR